MDIELYQNCQDALKVLYEAIVELLKKFPGGLSNTEITNELGLQSSQDGAQKDYLAYSLLGNLMKDNIVKKIKVEKNVKYKL